VTGEPKFSVLPTSVRSSAARCTWKQLTMQLLHAQGTLTSLAIALQCGLAIEILLFVPCCLVLQENAVKNTARTQQQHLQLQFPRSSGYRAAAPHRHQQWQAATEKAAAGMQQVLQPL